MIEAVYVNIGQVRHASPDSNTPGVPILINTCVTRDSCNNDDRCRNEIYLSTGT